MIFETHAHYDDKQFDEDRDAVIRAVHESGVHPIVNIAASLASTKTTLELAHKYDFVYAAVGVHPDEVEELNEETFSWLCEQATDERCVAVGEIGLDYYWHDSKEHKELQKFWFAKQLELARDVKLPVIIHSREAAADTMQVLKENHGEELPGIIHCYSYSKEMALEYVRMGYYIGVGGVVTFKNAKKLVETVEEVPMERIVLETDCPYLAPDPYRGTRNDSRNISYVIAKIAQIKGITPEEVERTAEENAYRLFSKNMLE